MIEQKHACEVSLGDKVDIHNGLNYEVIEICEAKNGKIRFTLYPYENSLSANKKISLVENQLINII